VRMSYNHGGSRATSVPVIIRHQDGQKEQRIDQTKKPDLPGSFVSLGRYRFEADTRGSVTIYTADTDGHVIVDAIQFLKIDESGNVPLAMLPESQEEKKQSTKNKKNATQISNLIVKQKSLNKDLRKLKRKFPGRALDTTMSVKDEDKMEDCHLLIRGVVRNNGPLVPRGFLRVMMKEGDKSGIPADHSGRLELANWIASDKNSLTIRVIVNRIWHYLMGAGLVRTTDNFGEIGERPSHPELLDHLASRFIKEGWSIKTTIRTIVHSRVYQMSSTPDSDKAKMDNENRLLWRANRKRLEAECIRDTMLIVSGRLDPSRGGLTIRKIEQYDLNYEFKSDRRSVYVPAFRNSVLDIFEVFDMANPNLVIGRRTASVLPTQSLFMMNSPRVIDLAGATASLNAGDSKNIPLLIEKFYRIILGRYPTTAEKKLSKVYLQSFKGDALTLGIQSFCHSLFASLDFRTLY